MSKPDQQLLTVNQIADKFGVAFWQVRHIVNSRRGIEPAVTHRSVKLYDAEGIAKIKAELTAIQARRSKHQNVNPVGSGAAANPVAPV